MKRLDATAQDHCKIGLEVETPTTLGLSHKETGQSLQLRVYAWLGYWRDNLPEQAVSNLQEILGKPHL